MGCGGDSAPAGELTVDGQVFRFDVESCTYADETGSGDLAFQLTGAGDHDGRSYTIDVRLIDLAGAGLGQTQLVSLRFEGAEEGYEALPDLSGQGPSLEVDDDAVTFAGEFTTVADQESAGSGTFEAACP